MVDKLQSAVVVVINQGYSGGHSCGGCGVGKKSALKAPRIHNMQARTRMPPCRSLTVLAVPNLSPSHPPAVKGRRVSRRQSWCDQAHHCDSGIHKDELRRPADQRGVRTRHSLHCNPFHPPARISGCVLASMHLSRCATATCGDFSYASP